MTFPMNKEPHMISESGRVVAVEQDSLWVETIQQSSCNSCAAKPGCGQGLMATWGLQTSHIRVLLGGRDSGAYPIGSWVEFGVPGAVVVNGSLFVYLLPLLGLVIGAGLGELWSASGSAAESVTAWSALLGFLLGGAIVRWHAFKTRNDPRLQPLLIDDLQSLLIK